MIKSKLVLLALCVLVVVACSKKSDPDPKAVQQEMQEQGNAPDMQ